MTPTPPRTPRRPIALAAFLAFASLLSCGREITGPGNGIHGQAATVAFAPRLALASNGSLTEIEALAHQFSDLVPFEKVLIVLRRGNTIVFSKTISFPAGSDSVALTATVELGPDATSEGEILSATLDYLNSDDIVVFSGGPIDVFARPGRASADQAVEIELQHVGPGSGGVFLDFFPDSLVGLMGDTLEFTSEAYDSSESFVEGAVILHTSRDTLVARVVNPGEPRVRLVGARGSTWIIAQLFDGDIDSARAIITPTATSLVIASGNNQQTLQGTAFAAPLRVQVRAADNLGVKDWPVTFAVTSGNGSLDSSVVLTDGNGFAEMTWTAGDSVGVATVAASIDTPALNVVFSGTQLSSDPTAIVFTTQPTNITAGVALPPITVEVRNGAGVVIDGFAGQVILELTGGNASAALVGGSTSVAAVDGVATFADLTVDRGAAGYRLVASLDGGPSAQSNLFNVAAAPATTIASISGGGQSAPAATTLTDSIVFLVTDAFGLPVAGVEVTIVGILGGGSVSPTAPLTDAEGLAAVAWTLGAAGPQQITAFVSGVAPVNVSATVFAGGVATLFAGYDYTYVPTGGSRMIPVFLSAPSATETWVYLTEADSTAAAWAADSVLFTPGMTQLGVQINGLANGETFVYLSSALGNDSVFISVDSAAVEFQYLDRSTIPVGDTLRMLVRLTHPAPPGGVTVIVRSPDPDHFLVAPGTGGGVPATGCFFGGSCGGDLRAADGGAPALTAAPADTAALFIAEGALTAQLAIIAVAPGVEGFASTDLTAEASGYVNSQLSIYSAQDELQIYGSSASFFEPVGEGQVFRGYAQRNNAAQSRDVVVTLTSRDEEAFTVDSIARILRDEYYSQDFTINAHVAGSAYLVFESPGYPTDSVLITVAAPELRLVSPDGGILDVGHSGFIYVSVSAAGTFYEYERQTPLPVTFEILGDTVIALDAMSTVLRVDEDSRGIGFRVIGPGDASVVVSASGHASDTVSFTTTVTGYIELHTGSPNAGVGQFASVQFGLPQHLRATGITTVTATSQNPAIARILTPTVEVTPGSYSSVLLIEGVSEGNATIVLSAPNVLNLEFNFNVTAPGLQLSNVGGIWDPDSVVRSIGAFAFSGGSGTRGVMDTVRSVLRSSDPAVVQVTDSIVDFLPGTSFAFNGKWRAIAPGSASLTLEAPGYTTSTPVVITVGQYELVVGSSWANVGLGLSTFLSVARTSPTSAALPVTITQTGPGNIALPVGGDTLGIGLSVHGLTVHGLSVGIDTLIFSAAGHKTDTLVIGVVAPEIHLSLSEPTPRVGWVDQYVAALLSHSGAFSGFGSPTEKRLVLTSLDTSIARVLQDTMIYPAGESAPSQYGEVQFTGVGYANLVVSDADSIFPPDTLQVFVDPRDIVGPGDGSGVLTMAMGQQTHEYEFYVGPELPLPTPSVFYLKSSDSSVVQVPDSVIVPAYYPFQTVTLTAGNAVGSARVSVSAPGWNEYEQDVVVTRGETVTYASSTYVGAQAFAELYIVDAISRTVRPMASPLTLRWRTDRPEIADAGAGTFEFPAGEFVMETVGPTGISVGQTLVQTEDTLPAGDIHKLLSQATPMTVYRRDLYVPQDRLILGRGLQSPTTTAYAYGISDSVWVRFESLGGKFALDVDSVYVGRQGLDSNADAPFNLRGLTLGTDTLVISADGFDSDSTLIEIHPGVLLMQEGLTAPTIQMGDSTLVTLYLQDGGGLPAVATDVLAINFATDTLLAVSDGTSDVSTMNIDPAATSVSFWVRGLQSGVSELVVTSADFRTFRFVFTIRPLPGE